MVKFEIDINGLEGFNLAYFGKSWNQNIVKKKLENNDYLKLWGALSLLCWKNKDLLEAYGLDAGRVVDEASIQDDELYLAGFEGYELSSRLVFSTLFQDENGRVLACIKDRKKDRFLTFVL